MPKKKNVIPFKGRRWTSAVAAIDNPKYRDFSPGVRRAADKRETHGPVKIIFSRTPADQQYHDPVDSKGEFAAYLRQVAPKCETEFLEALKTFEPYGLIFHHQAVICGFIADFWCPKVRLVVELDGPHHADRRHLDDQRDAVMMREDIKILRLESSMIHKDVESALTQVAYAAGLL